MLSLLVAVARNGVIGREGRLPWRLSADLQRFKRLTMGHHLVMGRKTLESIGRLLPGRTTIVLTRQPDYRPPAPCAGAVVARSLDEALQLAAGDDEVFVVGGGEIYRLALPRAERVYLTQVEADVPGDATFPPLDPAAWVLREKLRAPADEKNEYDYAFCLFERPGAAPMAGDAAAELLELNDRLLKSIVSGDWGTYVSLCDPSITCFEPEARGQVVAGMPFHKYYFDLPGSPQKPAKQVTVSQPHVRMMGNDAAVLSYVRLTQSLDASGAPQTSKMEETRVWQRINGAWKHVHFHRSANA